MGFLTTHVLDTAQGVPGSNMSVSLYRILDDQRQLLSQQMTNSDGRCDGPLLQDESFSIGLYELEFGVEAYFKQANVVQPSPAFLSEVTLRFGIAEAGEHYHVPLLVSPYSYSTYRGS
ncbi:MAG: 5-hydroxyisourate hydrolase [Candidatus Paceibacteria bacterium]|jgi:5-hydroxyisourate hydrolase|tara:strand:+ start:1140 stop:1493 length:354 start_codon:yes stop_codon:yes gene_type:complete